jgi:hypothetical protein
MALLRLLLLVVPGRALDHMRRRSAVAVVGRRGPQIWVHQQERHGGSRHE